MVVLLIVSVPVAGLIGLAVGEVFGVTAGLISYAVIQIGLPVVGIVQLLRK